MKLLRTDKKRRSFFIISTLLLASFFSTTHNIYAQTMSATNNFPYAVLAGGSKGIGYAIAEALAKRNYNLVLIARNAKDLQIAKEQLQKTYPIQVEVLSLDLADERSADSIAAWCEQRNLPVKMLCNIAGLGGTYDFLKLPMDSLRYMVRLNVESAVALSASLLPLLIENSPSHILNVASIAGMAPIPAKNIYSATKSAVIFFTYSLRYQLKDLGVSVSCLAPGPVFTKPSIEADTKKQLGIFGVWSAVPAKKVGEIAVRKTLKGRLMIVPGTLSKITSWVIRALPMRWVVALYSRLQK